MNTVSARTQIVVGERFTSGSHADAVAEKTTAIKTPRATATRGPSAVSAEPPRLWPIAIDRAQIVDATTTATIRCVQLSPWEDARTTAMTGPIATTMSPGFPDRRCAARWQPTRQRPFPIPFVSAHAGVDSRRGGVVANPYK